jgi:hypothetical protein
MGWRWLIGNFRRGAAESDVEKWAPGRGGARGRGGGRVLRRGQTRVRSRKSMKGGTRRLLHRNREENRGVGLGAPCGEMDGGGESSAGGATRRKEENRARRPSSCVGAAERGAGWAVSSTVRKQGRGRRAWAMREFVGRLGEGMN